MSAILTLISLGPGDLDYLPPIARRALESAEVVIGYRFYLDFIRPILSPKQRLIESRMGAEMERASMAIELAAKGQQVALVSSGDVGIYGMAGIVYEALRVRGWRSGDLPEVQVIPGITALQAAAARLGAAAANDFCAISLSDLLTPWAAIARRIDAAGRGDFVIAFYNPRSRERDWQLLQAQRILLLYRAADTPVAFVRNVTREDERVTITTLSKLDARLVDMFTLVVVGNSQTIQLGNQLATPRGSTPERERDDAPSLPHDAASAYPVTLTSLKGAPVIVVGGGRVGERKIKALLIAGAQVRLISPKITDRLQACIDSNRIERIARAYRAGDTAGALLVFAATNDRAVNAAIARECYAARILVNVADAPEECTFTLPAVARRDGLVIAISTDEHDPRRAVRVRDTLLGKIEL